MAEEIDVQLFYDWWQYWTQEPFGLEWHRSGVTSYYSVAALGGKPPPDFVEKFLPSYDPAPPMTDEEIRQKLNLIRNS